MSAFGGLFIGTSAIHAAQRGLDVTGQNIANSATEGYTRQRVDLESIGGPGVPAFWSRYDGTGEGVKVAGVTRMNDEFLEARSRNANAKLGNAEELQKTMAVVERTFGEPGETGLQSKLADFWNAWGKAGNDPKGEAPRNLAFERGVEVANHLNMMHDFLTTQWADTGSEMSANVTDVNTMAADVARLNDAIRHNNIAKVPANELLDQRDVLIKRITTLTGATARPAEADQGAGFNSQAVDVYIGDTKLVDGTQYRKLEITDPSGGRYPSDGTEPVDVTIRWGQQYSLAGVAQGAAAGTNVDVREGRIAGQLQSVNTTVPKYITSLNGVARQLAENVNTQQTKGHAFTMAGGAVTSSKPGEALFTTAGGQATGITAGNLRLAPGATPADLATSKGNPKGTPPALDGNNAMVMAAHLGDANGADATYAGMVVDLGVQTQSVNRNVQVQQNVVRQAEDARDNVAGVSLNEEMTNMIRYQHSFSAAAKFIGVIDETLQTLINMT